MIIRAKRKDRYTVVNNVAIEDANLSFRAKGILVFILSKPDDWSISERHLAAQGPDGRNAVATALNELAKAGYLHRQRIHQSDGTFVWQSTIFDEPQPALTGAQNEPGGSQRSTMAGLSIHGSTIHGKPGHIINTEQVNTEQVNNDLDSVEDDGAQAPPPPEPPTWYEGEAQPVDDAPRPSPLAPAPTVRSLTQQPPVSIYRDGFLRYPSKPQMALIMAHGIDDLRRWRDVIQHWIGRGWAPTNIAGMLDLYDHPERMAERRQPPAPAQPRQRPADAAADPVWQASWDEWINEITEMSKPKYAPALGD